MVYEGELTQGEDGHGRGGVGGEGCQDTKHTYEKFFKNNKNLPGSCGALL